MPCWVEIIVTATTIAANIVAIATLIGAIVIFFKNIRTQKRLPLIETRVGQKQFLKETGLFEREIYICLHNLTNKQFYISDCFIEYDGMKKALPIFDKAEKKENKYYDNRLNANVLPNAPCVINGVLWVEKGFVFPKNAKLLLEFTNGKSYRYELNKSRLIRQEDFD